MKKEATPLWADADAMKLIYLESRRLSKETGIKHHVDHVIPLLHPLVCGLHVETNLRILKAEDNWRKSNRFVPGEQQADGLSW